jgi:hypothetical protein
VVEAVTTTVTDDPFELTMNVLALVSTLLTAPCRSTSWPPGAETVVALGFVVTVAVGVVGIGTRVAAPVVATRVVTALVTALVWPAPASATLDGSGDIRMANAAQAPPTRTIPIEAKVTLLRKNDTGCPP